MPVYDHWNEVPGTACYSEEKAIKDGLICRYNSENYRRLLGNCMLCKRVGHYMHYCKEHPEEMILNDRMFIIYKTYPSDRPINPNIVAACVGQSPERGQAAPPGQWTRHEIRSYWSQELVPQPGTRFGQSRVAINMEAGITQTAVTKLAREQWKSISTYELEHLKQLANRSVWEAGFTA